MRWAPSLRKSNDLALAIDPITLSDRLCAIVVSVVYRGCAIPVARVAMPANKPERNCAQSIVKTAARDDNRHPGGGRSGAETESKRAPPKAAPERNRLASALRLGLATPSRLLTKGRIRRRVRLRPPDGVKVVCHSEIRNLPMQAHQWRWDSRVALGVRFQLTCPC